MTLKSNVSGLKPALDAQALALPVAGGVKQFSPVLRALSAMRVYAIEPAKVRDFQDPESGTMLRGDGSNLASVLGEMKRKDSETFGYLCELLNKIVPGTVNVQPVKHAKKMSLEFVQSWNHEKSLRFEGFLMSDGTLRALGILVSLLQTSAPTLAVIEEPEVDIHAEALHVILEVIKNASKSMQVIGSTHSTDLLEARWLQAEHVRLVTWEEGATRIRRLAESSVLALQKHLMGIGEMMRSNALVPAHLFDEQRGYQPSLFDESLV